MLSALGDFQFHVCSFRQAAAQDLSVPALCYRSDWSEHFTWYSWRAVIGHVVSRDFPSTALIGGKGSCRNTAAVKTRNHISSAFVYLAHPNSLQGNTFL